MSTSTHKLTPAEQRRQDNFDKIRADLESKGYRYTELLINILWANAFSLILFVPVIIVSMFILFSLHTDDVSFGFFTNGGPLRVVILIAVVFALIVVHEAVHGLTWGIFAENHLKDIEFGVIVKNLTPYCTCKTALPKGLYILGALMPLILLGIIPTIIGIAIGSFLTVLIGDVMIVSAAGDILIVHKILTYKTTSGDVLYFDHPTEAGGIIFEK